MNNFLLSTTSQQEILSLDNKIQETVETINSLKTSREFFLSSAKDPQLFINKWMQSQSRDLKTMTDVTGSPEEERRVDYYYQPWVSEGVCRFYHVCFWIALDLCFVSDISTARFSRRELSWTQAWGSGTKWEGRRVLICLFVALKSGGGFCHRLPIVCTYGYFPFLYHLFGMNKGLIPI